MTLNPNNPFNLEPEERLWGAIFGPTPEIVAKMQVGLDSMSNEDAFEYGKKAAEQYINLPEFYDHTVEELLQRGESLGLKFPQSTVMGFVARFLNEPRHTFEGALDQAKRLREEDLAGAEFITSEMDALSELATEEELYETGFSYGKRCREGWNSAQFDADQVRELLVAERGGRALNEHLSRGIRDAYAHRVTTVRSAA